jgi:diguanylate cyclase (GGDEF)-like protein
MGMLSNLLRQIKNNRTLIKLNKEAIREYNADALPSALLIACIVTLIPAIISIFRPNMLLVLPGYVFVFASCALLLVIFSQKKMRKYSLIGAYILIVLCFLLVLYLSMYSFKDRQAATALIYFAIIHFFFIDRPIRLYTTIFVFFVTHVVLAFVIKGQELGFIDGLNSLIAYLLGTLFGWIFLSSRLETFEVKRQPIIEKETDVLTGLDNRRKLFELINSFEKGEKKHPQAMIMIDIDHFKRYNDKYGHDTGDECLKVFGVFLRETASKYHMSIYRYGGEEFVGLIWDYDKQIVHDIAEIIRSKTHDLAMPQNSITISIGVVHCDDENITNCEAYLSRADRALYVAKSRGRNKVVVWDCRFEKEASNNHHS